MASGGGGGGGAGKYMYIVLNEVLKGKEICLTKV